MCITITKKHFFLVKFKNKNNIENYYVRINIKY